MELTKQKKCTSTELINWLVEHLEDCPSEWETDDFHGKNGTVIIFHTEND
tara:strand:- start:292 stop:441 length:150 start_codon:yes stop_codon:yes gene_type:complete